MHTLAELTTSNAGHSSALKNIMLTTGCRQVLLHSMGGAHTRLTHGQRDAGSQSIRPGMNTCVGSIGMGVGRPAGGRLQSAALIPLLHLYT